MPRLRDLYALRIKTAERGLFTTTQVQTMVDIDRLIKAALTATFQVLFDNHLRAALWECHKRQRIADGLSIGIERLYLREALGVVERLSNGIEWYIENVPQASSVDDEELAHAREFVEATAGVLG
ncbi:hypothetical protein [Aquabacterium sp.]|uniref:hypothetical protein n=1 Tax=Aquabacterium sp. TaxID=1872578 RepID=UPI004037FF4E